MNLDVKFYDSTKTFKADMSEIGQVIGVPGEAGATFTPIVTTPTDSSLRIEWSNNKGLENPPPIEITAPSGKDGLDGRDGANGKDGADGYTPVKGVDYFTDEDVQSIVNKTASKLIVIKTDMDAIAVAGAQYYLGEQTEVSVVLPDDALPGQMITVSWYNGATAATLSITGTMLTFDYTPSANSRSEINALWDGTYWSAISHEMEVPSK